MPDNFPAELIAMILAFLPNQDWRVQALVCSQWNEIVKELRIRANYDRERQRQLTVLRDSELWQILPAIVNDENILPYLEKHIFLHREPSISEFTFNACCNRMNELFPTHRSHPYWEKLTETYIKKHAQFIVDTCKRHHANSPETLENFLKFPLEDETSQQAVFQAYLEIEESFATLRILIQFWKKGNFQLTQQDCIDFVCDPAINHHLTGAGLLFLNDTYSFRQIGIYPTCLIQKLMEQSISSYQPENFSPSSPIDSVLSRITTSDWQNFLSLDVKKYFTRSRSKTIIKALECNHPIILVNLNGNILINIVHGNNGYDPYAFILKSDIAIKHLSIDDLLEIALFVIEEDFRDALNLNREFIKRLNFDSVKMILENARYLVRYFLLNAYFLTNLNESEKQIPIIAKFLIYDEAVEVFKSSAFLDFLEKMALSEGGQQKRKQLLIALAKADVRISKAMADGLEGFVSEFVDADVDSEVESVVEEDHAIPPTNIMTPIQPKSDNGRLIKPNNHWKLGLKIGGLILLGLIGVGIIAATGGIGAIVGVPILIQTLLFAVAGTCLLSAAGGLIYKFLTRKNTATCITATCEHSKSLLLSSPATMRRTLSTNSRSVANSKIIPNEDTYTSDTLSINQETQSVSKGRGGGQVPQYSKLIYNHTPNIIIGSSKNHPNLFTYST